MTTLINPRIIEHGPEAGRWEGCLSFPDAFARVPRARSVVVSYMNEKGEQVTERATGPLGPDIPA